MTGYTLRSAIVALILISMLSFTLHVAVGIAANAQSDMWYVGKGAEENTYYTYQIQEHDVNQGRPFLMTIYFKEFNDEGQYWVAPVTVVDQGRVINGTLHLSALDMSALGSSDIPSEMAPYRSGYSNSLQWLASFVPKPGQSLNAAYWGRIAAIGGEAIAPAGSAEVTVPAGTFDTTLVRWHKGVDNHIWVNANLPYPVKAETFADVTTGSPPIQYAFELQATGQGEPATPESQINVPKPPLEIQTARGTYTIRLLWEPEMITIGQPIKFGIIFTDGENLVTGVRYGFKVAESDGTVLEDLRNQRADDGTGIQELTFETDGPKDIEVTVESVGGTPMGMFVEKSTYGILVQPSAGNEAAPVAAQNQTTNATSTS